VVEGGRGRGRKGKRSIAPALTPKYFTLEPPLLEMPIYAPKFWFFGGSGPLKIIDHRRDHQKTHLHMKTLIMSVNAFNSVHICDL